MNNKSLLFFFVMSLMIENMCLWGYDNSYQSNSSNQAYGKRYYAKESSFTGRRISVKEAPHGSYVGNDTYIGGKVTKKVYTAQSDVYATQSADNSDAARRNMIHNLRNVRERQTISRNAQSGEAASERLSKFMASHTEASSRLAAIKLSLGAEFPDMHACLSRENSDYDNSSFTNTFGSTDLGNAEGAVRNMINEICNVERGNMDLVVAAVQSLQGTSESGDHHSNAYLHNRKIDVSNIQTAGGSRDYSSIFNGKLEVTPNEIVEYYQDLKNSILDDETKGIDTSHKQEQVKVLHELLANDLKNYNEEHNSTGFLGLSDKKDNVFLDLDKMDEYLQGEEEHIKNIKEIYYIPEEKGPTYYETLHSFLEAHPIASSTDEYLNNEDKRRMFRENTERLIDHASSNPSLEMATFLLGSASTNGGGGLLGNNKPHSEAIYEHEFTASNGYKLTVAQAMNIAQSLPESKEKRRLVADIISEGIGGYYEKNNKLGITESSSEGFHLNIDTSSLEHSFEHNNEKVWSHITEATKKNSKNNDTGSQDS